MDITQKAFVFALAAHGALGQKRKYTGEPYIVHPAEVANIVSTVDHTDEMIAAAFLHDVVEDTDITAIIIHTMFGKQVGDLVEWLTDISKPSDGNRKTRKAMDKAHSARAPAEAQTIKVADLISNSKTIIEYDKHFAKVYMKEMKDLLNVLTKADKKLLEQAWKIVNDYERNFK